MDYMPRRKGVRQGKGAVGFRLRPLRALVVDSHHPTLKVVYDMLTALGYHVDAANGGLAAMRCIRQSAYAVVVTNLQMADMDGYALAGWLKYSTEDTKVVIMTECCHSEVVNYMDTGIVDWWIFKPFGMNKLEAVIHNVVQDKVQASPCRRVSPNERLSNTVVLLGKESASQAKPAASPT